MKKHSKLMLQALGLAIVFTVSSGNVFAAAVVDNTPRPEVAVLKSAPVVNAPAPEIVHEASTATLVAETNDDATAKHEGEEPSKEKGKHHHRHHGHHGKKSDSSIRKDIKEHAMRHRMKTGSLFSRFNTAKDADAASVMPKTLTEIGMIVNDSDRRLEMFKYIQASAGKTVSAADKESFKKMMQTEVDNMRREAHEVRELIGDMSVEKNFSLMDEKEVLGLFHEATHHHHHDGAPKRKDARDLDGDGVVSKEEKKAAKKRRKDARDLDGDGVVSDEEKKAARSKRKHAGRRHHRNQNTAHVADGEHKDVPATVAANPVEATAAVNTDAPAK